MSAGNRLRLPSRGHPGVTLLTYSTTSAGPGASPCHIGRAVTLLRSAELLVRSPRDGLGGWDLGHAEDYTPDLSKFDGRPRPATSPDRVIDTEHINQLSRFHAQKLSVLNFVRFDQALYFFDKKLFVKNFLCQNFVCYKQIQIPRLLGGFLYEAIPLAYDY